MSFHLSDALGNSIEVSNISGQVLVVVNEVKFGTQTNIRFDKECLKNFREALDVCDLMTESKIEPVSG